MEEVEVIFDKILFVRYRGLINRIESRDDNEFRTSSDFTNHLKHNFLLFIYYLYHIYICKYFLFIFPILIYIFIHSCFKNTIFNYLDIYK